MKRNLKKLVALVSAAAVAFNLSFFVSASSYETVYDENFESYVPSDPENNEEIFDDSTYKIGKAAKTNRVASPNDPFVHHSFTPVVWSGEDALGANAYAEIELDVKTEGIGKNITAMLSFRGYQNSSNTNKEFLDLSFAGGENVIKLNKNKASLTKNLTSFSNGKWYRIKLVMKLTDAQGAALHSVEDVKVNGVSVLSEPAAFASAGPVNFNDIVTQVNRNASGDYALCIDNISVRTYTSESGESPIVEKGELLSLIRQAASDGVAEDYPYLVSAKRIFEDDAATTEDVRAEIENFVYPPTEVYLQDFESYTPEANEEIIEDDTFKIGKAAKTNRVASPNDPYVHHTFTPVEWSGTNTCAEIELDVMPVGLGTLNSSLISLRGYQDSSNTNKEFLDISFTGSDGKIKLNRNKTSQTVNLAPYSDNEWYRIKLVLELTDNTGSPVRTVKDIKINGESVLSEPAAFASAGPVNFNDIVTQVNRNAQGEYAVAVDNISVITYSGRSNAAEKGALLAQIRKWKNFIKKNTEYSPSDLQPVTDALNTAESVYNDSDALQNDIDNAAAAFNLIEFPETIAKEDFEGTDYIIDPNGNSFTEIADYTEYGTGKALKINQTTAGSVRLDLSGMQWPKAGSEQNNYAELELDFCASNMVGTGKHEYIYVRSGTTSLITLIFQAADGKIKIKGSGNETVLTSFEDGKWYRIKLVLNLTDGSGSAKNLIKAVYINGEETLSAPLEFSSAKTSITSIVFDASKLKDTDSSGTVYSQAVDNISIKMYNSEDGKTKLADGAAIVSTIRTVIQDIASGEESNVYSATELASFKAQLEEAKTVYENRGFDKEAVDSAIKKLKLLKEIMAASRNYNQSKNALVLPKAQYSHSSLSQGMTSVTVTRSAALTEKATSDFSGYAVCVLKRQAANSVYGEAADIILKKITLRPSESNTYDMTFDLSGYGSEIEDMYIKTYVTDKTGALLTDIEYLNGREAAFDKTGFLFNAGGVNIYPIKINASDRKLAITINSNPGKGTAVYVLKKDVSQSQFAIVDDDNYKSIIEYADCQVTDDNGDAVFEFNPEESGAYTVIVNTEGAAGAYTETVYFVETDSEINSAFAALYRNPTIEGLRENDNYRSLGVNKDLYENAENNGINVSSVVKAVLDEKTYNADNAGEFKLNFEQRVRFLSSIKTAGGYDEIESELTKNQALLPIELKNLSDADFRTAIGYIYDNREQVVSLETFDSVSAAAVSYAKSLHNKTPEGGGGGGGSGSIRITPSNPVTDANVNNNISEAMNKFKDIDNVPWAAEAITVFTLKGYINGKSENVFAPNDFVKREEFVKIAVCALGLYNEGANASFSDTDKNEWYYRYIASAYESGTVNGIGGNMFGVGSNLTREDAAVLIYRMLQKTNAELTKDGEYIKFIDDSDISDYAREGVEALAKSGIVNGYDNKLMPKNYCTRAEIVKMLYGAYKLL